MNSFNESFYTTDFDQEMMDFIKGNNNYELEDEYLNWHNYHYLLAYGKGRKVFWTDPADLGSYEMLTSLTKQQFKEKIGMLPQDNTPVKENLVEEGTFGKKDLAEGMFVKIKEEFYMLVGKTLSSYNLYILLEDYNENLEDYRETEWDITEVFVVDGEDGVAPLKYFLDGNGLRSIWKRTPPKSEKVIKLEELILMHEGQLEATKKLLEEGLALWKI